MKKYKSYDRASGGDFYYMYGRHPVLSAIRNKKRYIRQVYCTEKFFSIHKKELFELDIQIVDNDFLSHKIGIDRLHQGIIAYVKKLASSDCNRSDFDESNKGSDFSAYQMYSEQGYVIAILDQIKDPHNVGAILRNAAAFGVDEVIMSKQHCPGESGVIAKVACGALDEVKVTVISNIHSKLLKLKQDGFWIVGLDKNGDSRVDQISKIGRIAVIIGSEENGMRSLTKKECDFLVKINTTQKVESLNAATASGIFFSQIFDLRTHGISDIEIAQK